MQIAQINVYQSQQFGSDTRYSWSVKSFDAFGDESAGCPTGSGKHTIASALVDAVAAALDNGFGGARVTYHPTSGLCKSFDTNLAPSPMTTERGRNMANKLMES